MTKLRSKAPQSVKKPSTKAAATAEAPNRPAPLVWGAAFLIVTTALALRFAGSLDFFWFDEIWSLSFARSLHSALPIFAGPSFDNNHCLNTLWLYLLGQRPNWMVYRQMSVACGSLTVVVAASLVSCSLSRRWLVSALIFGLSYPLIHYSSEARGYAPMLLFALVAQLCFERRQTWRLGWLGFGLAVCLGFLAHPNFGQYYLGVLVYSAAQSLRAAPTRRAAFGWVARWHGLPLTFLALFYWFHLRLIEIGGGQRVRTHETLCQTLSLTLGGPTSGLLCICAALGAAVLLGFALRKNPQWPLYLLIALGSPLLFLTITPEGMLYFRYLLIPFTFLLLLFAQLTAGLLARGGKARLLGATLFALFLAGNAVHTLQFLRLGRGSYLPAFEYMLQNSDPSRPVTFGCDHDLRGAALLNFYGHYLPQDNRLQLVPLCQSAPKTPPEWFFASSFEDEAKFDKTLTLLGSSYHLEAIFLKYGLSGWHWGLYRKDEG